MFNIDWDAGMDWMCFKADFQVSYFSKGTDIFQSSNGAKYYFENGKFHRENGPAVEYENGPKSYYVHGTRYPEELTYWMALSELKKRENNDEQPKTNID